MLRAEDITVRAGAHVLLDRLTVGFAPGQLAAVAGPNGAGKTTLLRCLDGEMTPGSGRVMFAGRPIHRWPRRRLARMRAVLPQQSHLDFSFTVTEVVLMGRMPHSGGAAADRRIVAEVLERCGCAALAQRLYTRLSGGEQQRVQIARVLAQIWERGDVPMRFLLLDEPVTALDLNHQYALLRLLKHLSAVEGLGVICTLHNLNLVAQFADRVLLLERGMAVAEGAPAEVFTEETLGHVFDLDVAVRRHPEDDAIPLVLPRLSHLHAAE